MEITELFQTYTTPLITRTYELAIRKLIYGLLFVAIAGLIWTLCASAPGTPQQLWLIKAGCGIGVILGLVPATQGGYALLVLQSGPVGR